MAAHPRRLPTGSERERFWTDGAVPLRGVYQVDWVDLLREGVEQAMLTEGRYARRIQEAGEPVFFTDYLASDRVPLLRRFALEGPAAELSAALMNSRRANFLFDGIFVKEPGAAKQSTWHQDQPYYCVVGRQIVVLWHPWIRCRPMSVCSASGVHTSGVPPCLRCTSATAAISAAVNNTVSWSRPISRPIMPTGCFPGISNPETSWRSTA